MASAESRQSHAELAICRLVEEAGGLHTRFLGPACLASFESVSFLKSVEFKPRVKKILVASNLVLTKHHLEAIEKRQGKRRKRGEPSFKIVAEFATEGKKRSLERRPLSELYNSLKHDVLELNGVIYISITKRKQSSFLSRSLEGYCLNKENLTSLLASNQLQCLVFCGGKILRTRTYDLLQFESVLADDHTRFSSYFLRDEGQKRYVKEDDFEKDEKPFGAVILSKDYYLAGFLNFDRKIPKPVWVGLDSESASTRDPCPMENSYSSITVENDKGRLAVCLPTEKDKEMPQDNIARRFPTSEQSSLQSIPRAQNKGSLIVDLPSKNDKQETSSKEGPLGDLRLFATTTNRNVLEVPSNNNLQQKIPIVDFPDGYDNERRRHTFPLIFDPPKKEESDSKAKRGASVSQVQKRKIKLGENQKEIHSERVPQSLLASQNAAAGQAQQSTVKEEQQPLTSPIHGAHSQSPSADNGLCKTKEETMGGSLEGSPAPDLVTEPNGVDSTFEGSRKVEREPPFVNNEFCKEKKANESPTAVSRTSKAFKEEHDPTLGKARDCQDNLPMADQEERLETDDIGTKEVEEKSATRDTVTMDHKPSSKELQQKIQGQHNISGSVFIKEDSQTAQEDETETSSLSRSRDVRQEEIPQGTISKKVDKETQEGNRKLQQMHVKGQAPESGVTVVFNVLLASNFKMKEEKLFIRADGEDLGNSQIDCVEMMVAEKVKRKDKDKPVLYRGHVTISLDRAHKGTFYKYVVVSKGNAYWEDLLPEFASNVVSRGLKVPEKYIKAGATWNQLDGVTFVSGDQSKVKGTPKKKSLFTKDRAAEFRKMALISSLPKWEGFHVEDETQEMTATEAIANLDNVVDSLSSVWMEEAGSYDRRKLTHFDARLALTECLRPKMVANIHDLAKSKVGSRCHVSAAVSSLAIALLIKKYTIELKKEELISLLSCLALEVEPTEKKCIVYEAVFREFNPALRECAASAIESLCNQILKETSTTPNLEWLLAVPLLHFLRGDSKPFQELERSGSPDNIAWWGAQGLSIECSINQDFSQVLPRLASAFEVDRLLKRTVLRTIPVWQLGEIANTRLFLVSDLCVSLTTFFPSDRVAKEKLKSIEQCVQSMVNVIENENENESSRSQKEITEFTVCESLKLVVMFIERLCLRSDTELICLSIRLLFLSFHKWGLDEEIKTEEKESLKERVTGRLFEKLGQKIGGDFPNQMADGYNQREKSLRELKVWSMLFRAADGYQGVEAYRGHLTQQFFNRAKQMKQMSVVEIFCEVNLDQYDGAIGEVLTKLVSKAVEEIINSQQRADTDRAFKKLSDSSFRGDSRAEKCGELLSVLLTKSWPRRTDEANMSILDPVTVEFLLSWNPMTGYFRFFGGESERGSILTSDGQAMLFMAKSLLAALVKRISDASITVAILELLRKYKDRFLKLLEADSSELNTHTEKDMILDAEGHLNDRIEEIQKFQTLKMKVLSFINMCDLIPPVNVPFIKERVQKDVLFYEIGDLCERKDENVIEIKLFDLPPVIAEVLSPLHEVQHSSTFQDLWIRYGKKAQTVRENDKAQTRHLSLSKVVETVWKPAYEAWKQLCVSVLDGSLNLADVDKFFESYKNKNEDLEKELIYMSKLVHSQISIDIDQLRVLPKKRAFQIKQYQRLHTYANTADTIWEFKQTMGFSGDFKVIEDLRNLFSEEFEKRPLDVIGEEESERAGRALKYLDVDIAQCLKPVVDSKRLVEWLRTTITSTQELKVLVDLALISAGESDMETDRISNLHTSCLGFAPLIFDLRETKEQKVTFDQLMRACEPVRKALEADGTLPKKLFDTSRHLEWLKTVKESHGSVAVTSIFQAKMINSDGVYVVGNFLKQDFHEEGRLSLDQVVRLTVPPKKRGEDGSCDKIYSLDELKDLQSKLMLIAGKAEQGKDEVDTFVKNLEGIMRLAAAYINLLESGFVHRIHWCQEFHCSRDQRKGESIAQELARVSTAMEDCYSKWKRKVVNARKEYRELNFFTTQQLMLLRKELASACHRSQFHVENLQVFTLLESVRPSLDSEHLKAAIQRAHFKDSLEQDTNTFPYYTSLIFVHLLPFFSIFYLFNLFHLTPRQSKANSRGLSCQDNNYIERVPSMVGKTSQKTSQAQSLCAKRLKPNAAEDKGYSEKVALCARASVGVDAEEDDLLQRCSDEFDDSDVELLYDEAINNPVIAREINYEEITVDQEDQCDGKSGSVDDSLGGSFELSQSISEREEIRDEDNEEVISEYLTLSQLGLILRELTKKDKGSKPRTFPAFLKRGRPNLMLVPKVDVFATVLALYMHDKDQLLPSREEVLICSPETSTEEIELLWRRATGDLEGRFYCLVNADQLDFSVSKKAVDLLDEVTKGLAGKTGEHYGLVVICSSENEDRANIVAALDQHRVAAPPCPSAGLIQSYLKRQFRVPLPQYGYIKNRKITWNPAGFLDPEKLCVRVVSSDRGGLGKTLFVRRLTDQLRNLVNNNMVMSHSLSTSSLHVTVPLHGHSTDSSMLLDSLLPHEIRANVPPFRVFHLDVSPSVRRGLDTLLFNLLVLGSLCDKMGRLWRRRNSDLYIIEITTTADLPTGFSSKEENPKNHERQSGISSLSKRPFYDFLPTISCTSPRTVLQAKPDPNDLDPRMDVKEFKSPHFQRVYQYLKLSRKGENMDNFTFVPGNIDNDVKTCLSLLLSNCGIPDPSWSEIRHFVSFLNSQLRDCENSFYCDMTLMREILGQNVPNLEGFRSFVVRFMIQMSRDFATPSLTDENTMIFAKDEAELERKDIKQFNLRRSWESSPHPYLFFNQDHNTMTFLGFSINSDGDLVDPQTNRILEKRLIMSRSLRQGLEAQRVNFAVNPDNWKKAEKISKLCSVIGAQWINGNPNFDPDPTYELTTDNVKKIMAIHMRFRCNIPVIVMGETGCGKTRLVRYMCGLQAGPKPGPRNMLLFKVHGGTTYEDIEAKVKQAEKMAEENQNTKIDTVLFFDEANTTEALSMIKEVMVDRRIHGRPIGMGQERLQFIAACNPYRRHTDEMIYKLESAGLGYHVKTEELDDRLGRIPLRHLVYRVHALPGSMRPLIWDFGQLNHKVERIYTNQIVSRYILHERKLPGDSSTVRTVASVLAASQKYMRDQSDECSFVSLRDVERAMQVMVWFYNHVDILGRLMRNVIIEQRREEGDDANEDDNDVHEEELIHPMTRALVLAIGVCYHAKLQDRRQDFRKLVAQSFEAPCALSGGERQILREISSCQRAVLNELDLGPNIARNAALGENVFMMVVCIELRIPLFVVGKPGSSKSLAKTVVADNMQGDAAKSELFRTFKQVHMASYQCSPLSTPDGILGTFRQCRKLQDGKNLDRFVSVVVLDEVGLAEDSPLMPLKTLHPLLEDDVTSSDDVIETEEKPQRVAFIGISNWALDPAKMNRGIMLSRGVPGVLELVESALGICSTDKIIKNLIQPLIPPLANGYADLYKEQKDFETLKKCGKEEFFGLRDFYSLIKMVYAIAAKSGQRPGWHQLEHAIRRNFGGLIERKPVEIFKRQMANVQDSDDDPEARSLTTIRLIEASLEREDVADQTNFSENRYLLILTENYAALRIIQQRLLKTSDDAVVIFGSSFPNDQEYTQICRNINRIKVCMETGRTVILLNLESLYESLYDVLNQYYVYLGGQKYVDLGLGTHRVKCRVHDDFKLIVIAEKEVVYNSFPIPLINRLEKHFLVTSTSLTLEQMELVEKLRNWVDDFAEVTGTKKRNRVFSIGDSFVGFHEDTIPSVVMQVCNNLEEEQKEEEEKEEDDKIVRRCKNMLLEMATPDAIARLPASGLKAEAKVIWNVYFHEQEHSSLAVFMSHMLKSDKAHLKKRRQEGLLAQITTHSRLLSKHDLSVLCDQTAFRPSTVDFMSLQQFQTEQQFRTLVRFFFERLGGDSPGILIVQCDSGDDNFNLIAGARHILMEERNNAPELLSLPKIEPVHIVLVVQLPRISGGCRNFVGFQGGKWMSVHIDELRPPGRNTPSIEHLIDRPISELFRDGNQMQPETGKKAQMLAVNLMRNCVQAAACRVDNEAGSCDRSTQRIELLLQLLPENFEGINDEMTFASVLVQRTYKLLKESESTAYSASQWLYAEALSGTGVQEWGTFRKALWKRVHSSIVPILAEIIALADTDSNMDLMKNGSSWLPTVWLRILANPNISELYYSKIISPVTNTVRERVQVLGSGAGGHTFQCMFPFSFLIKQQVDKLLQSASSVAATSSASLVECLRDLIKNSETGCLFDGLRNEYLQASAYLSDYVHMVYKPSSTSELKLVCEAVISSARELGLKKDEDGNELLDMALIHVGHSRIQSRLRCFAKLVQVQPNVVPRLRENFRQNESEVLVDVVALRICLEEFNPSDEVLLDPDSALRWCDTVLSIRQSVEVMMGTERFQAATETTSNYGDKAKMLIGLCRSMWQRAGAVRLFVEHVISLNEQNSGFNSESVLRLWKALGEETDFSSLASLKTIEKFLINYSEEALKRGDESDYRRRCNAFFMELASLFCFGESSRALEEGPLSHLMRFVIGQQSTQTRDFSPFPDYQIDPIPVVRSFLLQQLLRSSQSFVKDHLDIFLEEAQNLQPEPQHIIDVCFLCVKCMEDNLISRYQAKIFDSKLTVKLKHAKKICDEVFAALETATCYSDKSFLMDANALENVAKGRYVLTLVANYLYKFFIEGDSNFSNDLEVQREFKYLLESVKRLCLESASTTPQLFLVRQLVRRYGFDCVRTFGTFQELQWIVPQETRQQEEVVIQDRFVVHEKQYRDVREGLAKGIIGKIEDLGDAMTEIEGEDVYKDVLLLLALYREVTLVNASSQRQNVCDEVKEKLIGFLRNDGNLSTTAQPFAIQLLQNDQGGDFRGLKVFPGKSPQDHTLAELIIHASIAMQCVGSGALTEPLYMLMTDPRSMMNSYLPTIPEDNFLDCIEAIGKTMKGGRPGEWYECGNCKFPYFIGECSKPMQKSKCPGCRGVLGGEQHKFLGEYAVAKRQDRTKTGHALGDPGSRPTVAEPQRNLSPILCSLVRIVMHAALVMGASRDAKATAQLIKPSCQPDVVAQFLWRHLQRDLDILGRALGRSVDDAALTVHLVLHQMILLNGGQTVNAHDMRLSTRESRRKWETEFSSVVIAPVVRQLDQNLQKALKLLMEDERFGSDPLVRQLYEFEEQIEDLSHGLRPMTRSLWKYRRQVTIEQLGNALQQATESTDDSQHKVLSAFLKQEHKLRCVQFLPDIVRLQRLLMDRFHRRIDRTDAEKFTIREFLRTLQRGPVKEEFNRLIQRFKLAWNSCRSFLGEQGRLRVPQDLCNITMDNDCSIAMLLPSTKGISVCSMALLFFLVNTNNEFLGIYRSATNQESPLERIPMTDVTLSQLIAYDPERDLLPLILAHCNYSLEVGGETFVQYDWTALERQLTDRFLKGRPFVDFKEERFAFSRDTRDNNVFASLADKIPQEAVSRAIEAQVNSDLRSSLSDVCDVLSSLDIAIGFLSSSGGQNTMPLKWYLHEVLKLPRERGLKSPTAEQHCNLSHILAMWRLMALEKAKIKSRNNQEPFEEMSDVFKVKLSSSVAGHLNRVLRKIDMEHFLPQLLEMILLKVKHADENVADMSFREYLELYLAEKNLDQIPGMENIPENVHMKHLQAVWSSAVKLCDDFRGGSQSLSA